MTQPFRPTRRTRQQSPHSRLFGTGDLNRTTRCSVIVAHPADEVVGAGCLISKLMDVRVLHVTDGAPDDMEFAKEAGFTEREKYAEARKQECLSALALANVSHKRVVDLDVVDRCAPNCLAELTRKVANFLQYSAADIVLTHPYEGGHPDHDATAFATHAAVRLIRKNGFRPPSLFEMALHPSVEGPAKLPEFLPGADGEMTTLLLDPRSLELKKKMFACFKSQQESLKVSPFGPERFRQPADYDFSSPARSGKLHYENFDWAISGDEWQSLAREALAELFPAANNQAEAHA